MKLPYSTHGGFFYFMKPKTVIFDGNFPTGDYLYRRYGLIGEVEIGESIDEAWEAAEKACFNRYAKQYPEWAEWFKNNQQVPMPDIPVIPKGVDFIKQVFEQQCNKKEEPLSIEGQIKSCTELKVLESYKFIVKGKPELELVYNQKLKELSK